MPVYAHNELVKLYYMLFGVDKSKISEWFPNGKNSVRIRFHDKSQAEIVFTYNTRDDYMLETRTAFIRRIKNENNIK